MSAMVRVRAIRRRSSPRDSQGIRIRSISKRRPGRQIELEDLFAKDPESRARQGKVRRRFEITPERITEIEPRKIRIDHVALEASVCRDSFEDFVRRFWSSIVNEPLIWNWHMGVLCQYLQEAAERVFLGLPKEHDYVINIPPGTTKSTIASIMFPAWVWTRMPSARFICSSYAHDLALDLSRKSRDLVKSEKYRRLFPGVELADDQDAKGYFLLKKGGFRYSVGIDGTVTGFHGHFLIVDDPLDPKRAVSEAEIKTANSFIGETLSQRKVDKKISVTVLIMQRLHQNDPSAKMLERAERGIPIRHVKLPAEITGTGTDQVRPRKLAFNYVNGLLDPNRLPRSVLEEARITLGQFGYSGQMLQNPVPLGGGMFKVEKIHIEEGNPRDNEFVREVRSWDKAGTKGGGAYTVGVRFAEDKKGRFWIRDLVRGQWESGTRETVIKSTAVLDGKRVEILLEQEPGSGGKESAENSVKRLAGYRVSLTRPGSATGDKALRADPFSVQVNIGNVHMVRAPWNAELLAELRHFPHSTYKDQTDALSGAFNHLTKRRFRIGAMRKRSKKT